MTEVISSLARWYDIRRGVKSTTLGFVPTMGDLHDGHLALVRRSIAENERTMVSLFVNPTQFDDPADLVAYSRPRKADEGKLQHLGADFVFCPEYAILYPDGFTYHVDETALSRQLCGRCRPGHFKGVLTVVMKLLGIAQATRAYFGEKDYQQFLLVRGMADAFFLSTEIVLCPTVRDPDGLALSSRNARLSGPQRAGAGRFHRLLLEAESPSLAEALLGQAGFEVEYVEEYAGRRFGAVRLGGVRLIDNVAHR